MLGFGVGFGAFLVPTDPNRYMKDWVRKAPSNLDPAPPDPEFDLNFLPVLSVDFGPLPWLRLQAATEVAFAIVEVRLFADDEERDSRAFEFVRLSESVTANLEYPINETQSTNIFVGAGPGLHHLVFEEHRATTVGFRAQFGIGLLQKAVRADGFIGFDYVRARSSKQQAWFNGQAGPFMLDYTSLHLSAIIHFNAVP